MKGPWPMLIAVFAGITALFWLTAGLSSLLFGEGWVSLSLADSIGSVVRLVVGAADTPRHAIPKPERASVPEDPVAFYCTAVGLLLGGALLVALAGGRVLRRLPSSASRSGGAGARPHAARWASWRDLRALRLRRPARGRVVIGQHGGTLIAAEQGRSLLVVAPTQTGKTSCLAIPAILEWEGPVLATSVKSDLLRDTLARRRALGEAMVYDPTGATSLPSVQATPLSGCGSWERTLGIAHSLVAAAKPERPGLESAEFWYGLALKLIAPLLWAARSSGGEMSDVMRWLDDGDVSEMELTDLLEAAGEPGALQAFRAVRAFDERQRSSVYGTAQQILFAYSDPLVLASARSAEYTPARLLDGGGHTLYLCAPAHEQARLRPIFATIVRELITVAYESATATGKPLDPPLLIVLDELANVAPITNLDEVASTGAGQGIQLVSIVQDLSQLSARYGTRSRSIVNNHTAKLFGPGLADPETLGYVTQLVGQSEFRQASQTSGEQGRRSHTEQTTYRELIHPGLIREASWGSGLLVYGNLPPAQIRLRYWRKDRRLRRLVENAETDQATEGAEAALLRGGGRGE